MQSPTPYRHTQLSRPLIAGAVIACVGAVWLAVRMEHPASIGITAVVGVVLALFSTLTVVVRDDEVDLRFGPGLIRRRIPLTRIRDVRAVRNRWYWGWGIRLTPHGWLWNVSGLGAVELEYENGRCFRIGTDEPDELTNALRRALPESDPASR